MMKFLLKERQKVFICFILLVWAGVIFLKQGGLSLIVHYSWPFILLVSFILLFNKNWRKNKNSWLHILTFLLLGVYLLTFLFDLTPSDGSLELMNISGGIILVLLLSQTKFDNKNFKFLFWGLILVISAADLWGFILYAGGHPFTRLAGPLIKQYEAFSGYPNLLANLNLIALIPGFLLFNDIKKKNSPSGIILFILNIIVIASLILTYSRAAWLAGALVVIMSAVFLLIKFRKQKMLSAKLIGSAVIILILGILLTALINGIRGVNDKTVSVSEKLTFSSEDEGSSITERIASFQRGVIMAVSHPLTGVGSGSFNYISQSFERNFDTLSSYPYSLPVKIFAENGFLVFIMLIGWLVWIIGHNFKNFEKFKFAAALTVIILLIHHSIDNNFDFFSASLPFFLLLGVIWPNEGNKTLINNCWILRPIIILLLLGIGFTIHETWYGRYYTSGRDFAGALEHENSFLNYEKSEQLFFPRDARMAEAIGAYELYKTAGSQDWLNKAKQKITDYASKDNPLDARAPLMLTQIAFEQKEYEECIKFAHQAKIKGGGNNFAFDYYETACTYELKDKEKLTAISKTIKPRLEKYLELLKNNSHMTVLTDNPKYAVKILDILRKDYYDYYDDFEGLYEDMFTTAKTELEKFHNKYGIKAETTLDS